MENMVPFCQGIWYHFLMEYGTIFFLNISLFQKQNKPFSFSILAFFILKMAIGAFNNNRSPPTSRFNASYRGVWWNDSSAPNVATDSTDLSCHNAEVFYFKDSTASKTGNLLALSFFLWHCSASMLLYLLLSLISVSPCHLTFYAGWLFSSRDCRRSSLSF